MTARSNPWVVLAALPVLLLFGAGVSPASAQALRGA